VKPYAGFPHFPHASSRWAKKIKGKMEYFGSWADGSQNALDNYLAWRDDLYSGRRPSKYSSDRFSVRDLCNQFRTSRQSKRDAGELVQQTYVDYVIPTELDKLFVVLEHDLPGRLQLDEIARGIATEEGELPDGDELGAVLDAATGLTRFEAEGSFSLSLVREGRLTPRSVWELKSQMLKKSGLLSLYYGRESFQDLGSGWLGSDCRRTTDHCLWRTIGSPPPAGIPGQWSPCWGRSAGQIHANIQAEVPADRPQPPCRSPGNNATTDSTYFGYIDSPPRRFIKRSFLGTLPRFPRPASSRPCQCPVY
jgi:hypothetical protein